MTAAIILGDRGPGVAAGAHRHLALVRRLLLSYIKLQATGYKCLVPFGCKVLRHVDPRTVNSGSSEGAEKGMVSLTSSHPSRSTEPPWQTKTPPYSAN
jgi:hypothetical protein